MTLQQFDDVLNSWKARLSAIAENLMELQADSTYQVLTGTGSPEQVSVKGATAVSVGSALKTMNELFLKFGPLQSTIDRALEIRSGLPSVFGSEAKLQAMHGLLFTQSIDLQTSDLPLAERGLLSGAQVSQRVTPEELLNSMTQTFSQVRDAVAAVGEAWAEYSAVLERVEGEVARYRSQVVLPSRLLAPTLNEVETKLRETQGLVQSDPVGALDVLRSQVEPVVASVAQRVALAEVLWQKLQAARSRWRMLEDTHREAVAVAAEARARLTASSCEAEPVPQGKLQALNEWLGRLDRKRDEGATEAVTIGLRNWSAAAETCMAQDTQCLSECEVQLSVRSELRGRLEALKARARARDVAGVPGLLTLHDEAEDLLLAQPTDLRLAKEAIAQFEQRLHGYPSRSEAGRSEGSR